MKLKSPVNKNYCATVVRLDKFVDIDNCDNLKHAIIFGNSVIVSKDTQQYTYGLYFPIETKLSDEFLRENNLYKNSELNKDPLQKGYFENNGRVRCVKFRGNKSEGFFIGVSSLLPFVESRDLVRTFIVGVEFDEVNGIKICEKYVVPTKESGYQKSKKPVTGISRLVDNQFRLHCDTENLRKNISLLKPEDTVSITYKLHGTSFVVGKVLTKKKRTWYQRLLGHKQEFVYDVIYSSRRVVKNEYETKTNNHFYKYDIWGEIKDNIKDSIENGITLYGEAVGYLKDGEMIQEDYDYGYKNPLDSIEPTGTDIPFKDRTGVYIYHITYTNNDGKVMNFTWGQVEEYCRKYGLKCAPRLYYGRLGKLFPLNEEDHWHENLLRKLESQYTKGDCYLCKNKVPLEGIVVVKDELFNHCPYKLKSFEFLERETKQLDKGIVDIESQESINGA